MNTLVAGPGKLRLRGVILSADGTIKSPFTLASVAGWRRAFWQWLFPSELTHSVAQRNALADQVVDAFDVGSTNAAGSIRIYTDNYQTLLSQILMDDPAFAAAANGVANGNTLPWSDTQALASGIPAKFDIVDRDETPVLYGDVAAAGGELTFPDLEINANDTVKILSASYTAPP